MLGKAINFEFGNKINEETKLLISEMEKTFEAKDNKIQAKEAEINKLKNELDDLRNQILNNNKRIIWEILRELSWRTSLKT
ncbi:hypothetical protein [Clostridium sp.]|uniref:hypothetical protein n=1 Tax=Clostridium sp. TaxID=1506 RepID=UPI00261824CD